jgi:hypothetical protein
MGFLFFHPQTYPEHKRVKRRRTCIHSDDFLALSKIRGCWGGFETLEKWVTGAYGGHTAVCSHDGEENLWVGESGHQNDMVFSLSLTFADLSFSGIH